MTAEAITHPDVEVELVGHDGNAFVIIGSVAKEIRRSHGADAAKAYTDAAMECGSYDDLLRLTMQTVVVT